MTRDDRRISEGEKVIGELHLKNSGDRRNLLALKFVLYIMYPSYPFQFEGSDGCSFWRERK